MAPPDFDLIARRIAGVWGDSSTLAPLSEAIAKQLQQVWNARGAADLDVLENKAADWFDGLLQIKSLDR